MARRLYAKDHLDVGRALAALGSLRMALNDFKAPETLAREQLQIFRSSFPGDHDGLVSALVGLGEYWTLRGRSPWC